MAFDKTRLSMMAVSGVKDASGDPKGVGFYFYHAHGDDVTAAKYFEDAMDLGVKENDLVYVPDDDSGNPMLGYIDSNGTLEDLEVTPQT